MRRLADVLQVTRVPRPDASGSRPTDPESVCPICKGAGYVREDVPVGHPHFGRAIICDCRAVEDEVFDLEKDLQGTLTVHRESQGRIAWAASFDARDFEKPDFSSRVIARLNQCFAQQAIGVKIWKNIGMSIRSKSGEYLMADNPVFFPIYEAIQKADRTLIAHLADPSGMWQAPRADTPRTSPAC